MKSLLRKLACFLFGHIWDEEYYVDTNYRKCTRCNKAQMWMRESLTSIYGFWKDF